jgi:3-methyl-2-oxobutanoate hydroxymethyltransferase
MKEAMHRERVGGFKDFIQEVRDGVFPAPEHVIDSTDDFISEFLDQID